MKHLIALLIALLALPALAQDVTPNSPCGAKAVGKRPDNNMIVEHQAGNMYVDPNGYWALCPSVHESAPVPPKDCLPRGGYVWEVDGNVCTTMWSGQGAGVPLLPHKGSKVLIQDNGPYRGSVALLCLDGQLKEIGATCAPAVTCPAHTRIQIAAELWVTVDARVTPLAGDVLALSADPSDKFEGSAILRCEFGGWSFVESPVVRRK